MATQQHLEIIMHIAVLKSPKRTWRVLRYKGKYTVVLESNLCGEFEHDIRNSLDCGATLQQKHPKRGWNDYRQRQLDRLNKDVEQYTPQPPPDLY